MRRRDLLTGLAIAALTAGTLRAEAAVTRRVRPGDARWPTDAEWAGLRGSIGLNVVTGMVALVRAISS